MIIIRKDTVWGPGDGFMYDDVQIAKGATLTILPGAQISGNGYKLEAFGSVVAKGTQAKPIFFNDVELDHGRGDDTKGSFNISFAHINGGSLLGISSAHKGDLVITNSIITGVDERIGTSIYDEDEFVFSNNVVLESEGITNYYTKNANISYNIFERYHEYVTSYGYITNGYAIRSYGSFEVAPVSTGNAFLDGGNATLVLSGPYAELKSVEDYFGTTDKNVIQKMLVDNKDDLEIVNYIKLVSPSSAPSAIIKTYTFSFTSLVIPSEIIIEARLFGLASIDVTGNKLNNKLIGNVGNNTINGGLGADTMAGGAGNDTYIVDNVGDVIVESSNKGTDSVVASVSYALSANVEALTLAGTKAINATGNALANHLIGNGAANVLDGKAGADVMEGGAGNDTYHVDHKADRIVEAVGEGTDTLVSTVSYALAAGQAVETLQFAKSVGTAALDLTGNEFANTLVGSAGDNVLNGGGGADALYGGSGNDTYVVDTINDKVSEANGGGTDAVLSSVSTALKGGQEIESLQLLAATGSAALNLTGNEFAQSLRGNAGANVLNGGLGHDVLTGGKGADTFAFSTALGSTNVDRITDFAAEDTIRLAKSVFSALALGQLADGAFKSVAAISTAKLDADDRILYKQSTGELFYDADGSGAGVAVKFAVLDNKAVLTAGDFLIS